MQVDYFAFVERMIGKYEGGYCWDAGDPGGPTKYGITCFDLAAHRRQKMTSMAAWAPIVKAMAITEAEDIYGTKYKGDFDDLPAGPDCVEFDYKVNSGIGRVALVRPRILKLAGKATVQDCDPKWYVDAMCKERRTFLDTLAQRKPQFKRGWDARVDDLDAYCDHLTEGGHPLAAPAAGPPVAPMPKASHTDPTLAGHVTATVAGHAAATGTAASQGLHWPAAVALGVVGIGAIALWAAWRAHKNQVLNTTVVLPSTIPPHP